MRLWSLHPRYLDAKGLVALWREALLAQKVLQGDTRGYRNHPQLDRFKELRNPVAGLAEYLRAVQAEATQRAYQFDASKIATDRMRSKLTVSSGQMAFEVQHLLAKLKQRDPQRFATLCLRKRFEAHPLFQRVPGGIADWEII